MLFLLSFFVKESNAAQTMFTPLFPKVQTFAELTFFEAIIVITSYFNLTGRKGSDNIRNKQDIN